MHLKSHILTTLTDTDDKTLSDQDVCLDDWDYMIAIEAKTCPKELFKREPENKLYQPTDYDIERLLQGCCSNYWYKVKIDLGDGQKDYFLGVAYHA